MTLPSIFFLSTISFVFNDVPSISTKNFTECRTRTTAVWFPNFTRVVWTPMLNAFNPTLNCSEIRRIKLNVSAYLPSNLYLIIRYEFVTFHETITLYGRSFISERSPVTAIEAIHLRELELFIMKDYRNLSTARRWIINYHLFIFRRISSREIHLRSTENSSSQRRLQRSKHSTEFICILKIDSSSGNWNNKGRPSSGS